MDFYSYYKKIQLESARKALKNTCHLLVLKNNNPHPYASGVFIQIQSAKFLISAAHVSEEVDNEMYVGIDRHDLLKLGGEATKNIALDSRNDDKIDIFILKLDQNTIDKLGNAYQFLNSDELGINHELFILPLYTSIGFPASRSKYNSFKDEIKSKPFIFSTMPANLTLYEKLNCKSAEQIIIHYDKKKIRDSKTGLLITGPDPYGISGSGLWFTPPQFVNNGNNIKKRLVAILTEWPKENRRFWIATRIDIITEVIRQKYNLTLEKSRIINVNINQK